MISMKVLFLIFIFFNVLYSNQTTIKIAIPNNMIPYAFIDEYNEPKGMFVDYWKLWATKTNQKIEFVPSVWQDTITAIKDNKADIHSGLFIMMKEKDI